MPEDSDLHDLERAFQLHVIDLVVEADLLESSKEKERLEQLFPKSQLQLAGLVHENGTRTERFHRQVAEALERLPVLLDAEARLALLHGIVRIAAADRVFRLGEGSVLLQAARLLGLSDDDFDAFLAIYPEATGMNAALLDSSEQ